MGDKSEKFMDYLWTEFKNSGKKHIIGQNLQNAKSLQTRLKSSFFRFYKTHRMI